MLPQALPAILPALTSQYLNLAKNSTLAIAVGYADLYAVSDTTITQTGRAIEGFLLLLFSFLLLNLMISGGMAATSTERCSVGCGGVADDALGGSSDHIAAVGPAGWGGWGVLHWLLQGAEWSVVSANLPLYAGSYPADQR